MNTERIHINPDDNLRHAYDNLYKRESSDTPDKAQTTLAHMLMQHIRQLDNSDKQLNILHIGAGTQSLEALMLNSYSQREDKMKLKNSNFYTIDIANIDRLKLKAQKRQNVSHIQADGSSLPIRDASIDICISNMAIDFMPREAFSELARVLNPGGHFIITLHHPKMMDAISKQELVPESKAFVDFFIDNRMFRSEEEIEKTLTTNNLIVDSISIGNDSSWGSHDAWWLVSGHKPK